MEGGRPPPGEAGGGGEAAAAATPTPIVPSETQLAHTWPLFLRGPQELHFASGAMLRQQLEEEMREVQNYVDHIRALTEARDALAAEYERENEELRRRFTQLQLEHESQLKEVAELLALEGLASIVHSSPSEQVAYLLVERSTLLERMEALEQELGAPHGPGRPCAAPVQVQLPSVGEPDGGQPRWEEGLEGAPDRLRSTQEEGIPALKEDQEAAEAEQGKLCHLAGAEIWQGMVGQEDEGPQLPIEPLAKPSLPREPLSALGPNSHTAPELRKASEQNLLTDRLLLHDRLCPPEAEGQASLGDSEASDLGGCFKHELHGYRSEVLRLYGELQGLQGATEERRFLHQAHQKLLHQNGRLEAKVLELSRECECLTQRLLRGGKVEEEEEEEEEGAVLASRLSCPEFPASGHEALNPGGEARWSSEPPSLSWSEASKTGEVEEPGQAKQQEEEEEEEDDEDSSFLKDILAMQHQLSAHRETHGAAAHPCPPGAALGSATGEQGPPHQEETPGLLRGPRQAPSSGGSAKKQQLRLEQEGSLELRLQNLQLQQETLQMQAQLRQAQVKVLEALEAWGLLALQGELSRQKVKDLELQLLQHSQDAQQQHKHLQEQLAQESERAAQAERRVEELEQGLQERQQLWESQAALGRRQLEEEAREARAKEAEARRSLQKEQKRRKLLEQERSGEQQEQQRLWLEKEAQLLQALADQEAQVQQQEGQLKALEEEKRSLAQEQLHCQSRSQRLSEELWAVQWEKEALCEEQRQRLKQADVSLRKQKERRLRHRAQLRQAKEALLEEVKPRDARIRHLEDEVRLSKIQAEKDQLVFQKVMEENESLLREQRKIQEAEHRNRLELRVLQSRAELLDRDNLRLHERGLQLSLQVGVLERALRIIHGHSLQELRSLGFPKSPLQRMPLPFHGFSHCQALREGPPVEPLPKALVSPLAFQGSCAGCLNVSGRRNSPDAPQDQTGQPGG